MPEPSDNGNAADSSVAVERAPGGARDESRPAEPGRVEIRAEGIRKSFGEQVVLDGIDLQVRSGEIVVVVGGSGSGKSVLLHNLTGLTKPDAGRVLVADHSRPGAPLADLWGLGGDALDRLRLHWSIVFQRNALFSGSVRDNIALWLREHTRLNQRQIQRRIRESLQAVALEPADVIDKDREQLSGGMAKRVAIARAIAMDPALIFFDEPTTGLDPVVAARIHELIWDVHHRPRHDGGERTTVIVTHDKDLLRRMRPRIVMLHGGKSCFDGPYERFGRGDCPPAREYLRAMPVLHARPLGG